MLIYGRTEVRRWCAVLLALALSMVAALPAQAQGTASADFYKGKTVRIVVGYAPGGGYDAYARLMAPHLGTRLGATVIVENQPGAGGFNALSALLREPGDGLRMLLLNGEAAVLTQLVEAQGMKFDLRKLAYLGRMSYENRTLVTRKGGEYERLEDLVKSRKTVHFGSGDRIDTMGDPASILCHALRLTCKLVTGYKGAPDAALAMQRGEVDAIVTSESQTASFLKGNSVVAVAILSTRKAPLLPDVRSVFDLVQLSPEQARWLRFRADLADFGRVLIMPGDAPADRVALMEKAVADVLGDPKVQAEGARTNRPIDFAPAGDSRQFIEKTLGALDAGDKAFIKQLLLSAY